MPSFRRPQQKDFLLGVLVGIYGNWLIAFFDRLVFPTELGTNFFIQLFLAVSSFVTFVLYIMFAYLQKYHPSFFASLHGILPLITFIFQDAFIEANPITLSQNTVFWVIGFPIFCLTFTFEFLLWGRYQNRILEKRWKKPLKIGILNDMGWNITNEEISNYSDFSPLDWVKSLKSYPKTKSELTNVKHSFDKFSAILNPYGGVYPESDLKNLSTLEKIKDFVRNGGIFINVADIPSYWAYDEKLGRKLDTTSPIFVINNNQLRLLRPFEMTPLMKELGLRVLNMDKAPSQQDLSQFTNSKVKVSSKRVVIVEANVDTCIPSKSIPTSPNPTETSSLFTVKYGDGFFLFSLIFMNENPHTQEAQNAIKNAILKNTIRLLEVNLNLHTKKSHCCFL